MATCALDISQEIFNEYFDSFESPLEHRLRNVSLIVKAIHECLSSWLVWHFLLNTTETAIEIVYHSSQEDTLGKFLEK